MSRFISILIWSYLCLTIGAGYAQQSSNVVDFQVTYDLTTNRYTAWVVPRYNIPNENNTGTTERGGTAQYTLKVPASFSIVEITDVRGTWEKEPLRLGPGNPGQDWSGSGLDPSINYYVIGKSPSETNYGSFVSGTPVALFTFRGNGCFGPVSPLEPGNAFITQADQRFSLNVANSFYSVSGQRLLGNQNPLEQYRTITGPAAQCELLQANADLFLTKQVSQSVAAIGTSVSFTLTVQNLGPGGAVGVSVADTLNGVTQLQGTPTVSKGSFNAATGVWTVGDLAAGEVATLILTMTVQLEGVLTNVAGATATGSLDPNPANNRASSCASVPVRLCAGDQFIATVPSSYQDIRWFRDGTLVATGNTFTITQPGIYTVASSTGTCPLSGCCPIIVEAGDCCPAPLCVPLVIQKTKSRL